ncbi:MAG: hypothetical protein IJQ00_02970, partial [Kiritimatiellae bacterium]|nr:hypothetical protein [Kiritimatiellia bacterium]
WACEQVCEWVVYTTSRTEPCRVDPNRQVTPHLLADARTPCPILQNSQKFVHPANANRSHHKRTNFQGRRQPDFGQK